MKQVNDTPIPFYLFSTDTDISLPESSILYPSKVQLDWHILTTNLLRPNEYGSSGSLYWLWKNVQAPYIAFSFNNAYPNIASEELSDFLLSNDNVILNTQLFLHCPLQENYRSMYYGYDFRMMLSVLKRIAPKYHTYATKDVFVKNNYLEPCGIFKWNVFSDFCRWLFPILQECQKHLPPRYSIFQSHNLEYLTYYLFILYFRYNEKKLKIRHVKYGHFDKVEDSKTMQGDNLAEDVIKLLKERKVETAQALLEKGDPNKEYKELHSLFSEYNKQRRYYRTTILDEWQNKEILPVKEKIEMPLVRTAKPKVLILKWASVSHEESVRAFEELGFECHIFPLPDDKEFVYSESHLVQFNGHLDAYHFDMVFSLNFFGMMAEACYVHDIPYVAWTYDSPSPVGDIRYLKYPTSHVFFFDSADRDDYFAEGCTNVKYMPLAVNVDRYDKMLGTPSQIEKYSSEISFVGRLYDSKLPEAIGYLDDYAKAYINALIDYQQPLYGYSVFPNVLTDKFMEQFGNKKFNEIINMEADKNLKAGTPAALETPSAHRLNLVLNRWTTNRDRLLLISLLSKHRQFKLYSTSSNPLFKDTIECGTVNYYNEMPLVFRYSKINLNITFRPIRTGMPLRCLDIMGCHGLLLTNHQKDFDEHFTDGKNLLFYHSFEEAYEKSEYYLNHETERQKIANAGYETVKKHYNYPVVLRKILEEAGLGYLPARR